ncbi:type II toxin-antitoxin system VapC family toxin [Oharaeibacter diazotrophicus]|uniref:Putative nucleic acid-binding protein n=1 Tax=Oharaeibacter diazotrophicus TaxID=1920512 RepID=A0A4R6R812_9HYPH|nr:type II toxin-antitoxin system VapC family toxin [Oharaeibacter diazotrophicus]TDP81994.1 putative nucleic acid-binding protein [Oharaeibacter diazotrophicus]BBE73626.1 hypothetical protein OHA_1_03240 [Pleomorphomonas sp. SM30]GLS75415.1 twitching motility protein PilT [Oharaeibacter diazotrophicus]
MTGLVLDCSAALTWAFEDEWSEAAARLLARVEEQGAVVPSIWRLEFANVLVLAERRGRIVAGGARVRLAEIERLPIRTDENGQTWVWTATVDLAVAERLTVYDASYLELALRLSLPLATKDRDLVAAARRRGADLIPLMDA